MYIYTVEDLIGKYAIMIPISSANDPNYNQISYQQLHSANDPNSVMYSSACEERLDFIYVY